MMARLALVWMLVGLLHAESCLHKQGLVKVDMVASDVLAHHAKTCEEKSRNFANTVLGYITPWNPDGRRVALTYAAKFDILAPVWHNVVLVERQYHVTGENNYDDDFLTKLRKENPKLKIMPRFNLEKDAIAKYRELGGDGESKAIAELVTDYAKRMHYDGLVLETGINFYYPDMQELMGNLIRHVGTVARDKGLGLVITLFLHRSLSDPLPDLDAYSELAEYVDHINVMVYDFIQEDKHAPLDWAIKTLDVIAEGNSIPLEKIIIGVPFYGYTFTDKDPQPTMGKDYVKLLGQKSPPLFKWNPGQEEHTFARKDYIGKNLETRLVVYPSLYFLERRLQICRERGCGIGIWELGQGLNYFMSLFQPKQYVCDQIDNV